jgi:hypothetical protein
MNAITAFFCPDQALREPAPSVEARISRVERRIVWLEEQLDEVFYHQVEAAAAVARGARSDATVAP